MVLLGPGLAVVLLGGCGAGPEASYGRSRGESLNGTGTLAALLRDQGHEVRTARRLTTELEEWADMIVRFAPNPGPPDVEEAQWYSQWLDQQKGRALIYVPRDYDARDEYWSAVLARLPADAPADRRSQATALRDAARSWPLHLPPEAKALAGSEEWFAVEAPKVNTVTVCAVLGGPWGRGIDAAKAALPRHQTLKVGPERVLLTGDGRALAMDWSRNNGSQVLVVASGAFLVNAALANPARRVLALDVVEWPGGGARKLAFVEGPSVVGEPAGPRSPLELLAEPPFGWVAAQMFVLGLAACLARAPILGRPRPEPPSGIDRPAAHAEALGVLLARTAQPAAARVPLEVFRQWRRKPAAGSSGPEGASPGKNVGD
jgi:hypothetical protein